MSKKKHNEIELLKLNREYSVVHSVDSENRVIRITGAIGTPVLGEDGTEYFDFSTIDIALNILEKESLEPIIIRINSPGGECYEALAIIGRMKRSPCSITTEGYGHVMSAATLILMSGDIRKLSKYCITMFHKMSLGVGGNLDEIDEQIEQSKIEQKLWAKYYQDFSHKSAKFWLGKMLKKEYYPTPEEMIKIGAVDELF